MEADHASNGRPSFGALPGSRFHRSVGGALRVGNACVGGTRSSCVVVVEIVPGVNMGLAIGVGQHESVGEQVLRAFLVGECGAAFRVPVRDENRGLRGVDPSIAADLQKTILAVGDVRGERDGKMVRKVELRNLPILQVFAGLNFRCFLGVADHLLLEEDVVGVPAACSSQLRLDGLHVLTGDMLDRVHTESIDSQIEQFLEIARELVLHIGLTGVKVLQAGEPAVLDLPCVGVVADVLAAGVEVLLGVGDCGEISRRVVRVACRPLTGALVHAGCVVDDGICNDAHAGGLACCDHVGEFLLGAEFGMKRIAHRLI